MPGNGPAKRQVELMECRRPAIVDGSDGAGARRRGRNLCVKGFSTPDSKLHSALKNFKLT